MNSKPSKQLFLEAIAKIERFSPAPRILSQATRLLQNPDSDLDDIAKLIRSDAALMSDILRGANSAFYALGEKVSSLDRAIQKIGFMECMRLLKLSVAHCMAARDLGSYGIEAEDFWAESLFNGIFMETVAADIGSIEADTAHTTGLLRYVGRLAINQCLHDFGIGLFWNGQTNLRDWELDNVGFVQSEAAAHLLRAWRFPEEVVNAIEWQSEPDKAPHGSRLLDLMFFAQQVLPEGRSIDLVKGPIDETTLVVPETAFAQQQEVTQEKLGDWLETCVEKYAEINDKLYTGGKAVKS